MAVKPATACLGVLAAGILVWSAPLLCEEMTRDVDVGSGPHGPARTLAGDGAVATSPVVGGRQVGGSDPARESAPAADAPRLTTLKGLVFANILGGPVSNANVVLKYPSRGDGAGQLSTITRIDGSFLFEDVPVGRVSLVVNHPGHPYIADRPFDVFSGEENERTLFLRGPATIVGTIADTAGNPLADATVFVTLVDGEALLGLSAKSDAQGLFSFAGGLPAGRYRIEREPDGVAGPFLVCRAEITAAHGEARTVMLRPPGLCRVSGVLRPIEEFALPREVAVELTLHEGPKNGIAFRAVAVDGRFEVHGLPAGTYSASARDEGLQWRPEGKFTIRQGAPAAIELVPDTEDAKTIRTLRAMRRIAERNKRR